MEGRDHEREVLESLVTKKHDKANALKFPKKAMKRCGNPYVIMTDSCPSYRAAMKVIGNEGCQGLQDGPFLNNRAVNSHLPFRRRERVMSRFRRFRSLQKFASIYSSVCDYFNLERQVKKGFHSSRNDMPRFASGTASSSPDTCSSANNRDGFALD